MENRIEAVVEQLKSEEERLKNELATMKKREQELRTELKRVQAGLSGLDKKQTRKAPAAKKSKAVKTVEPNPSIFDTEVLT